MTVKSKKSLFVLFFLFSFVIMVWSTNKPIIVNEDIFIYYWTDILAGIITIYVMFFFIKELRNEWNDTIKSIKLFILVIASPFIVPFFIKLFFEQSLMLLFHKLTSEKSIKIVKVKDKISLRRCRNGIELQGYSFVNGRICGIPEEHLNRLKYGDQLTIEGESSYFGFTTEKIKYIYKEKKEPTDISPDVDWKKQPSKSYKVL